MPAPYERYTEELHDQYGYLATWLPNLKLKLGDVGRLKRDRFEFVTDLNHLGISFETREAGESANYDYVSADGAGVEFQASGETAGIGTALGQSRATAAVSFKRANAVVFIAR